MSVHQHVDHCYRSPAIALSSNTTLGLGWGDLTELVNMLWRRFGVKSLPRISGRDPADGLHEQPCQRHDAEMHAAACRWSSLRGTR